MSDKVRNWMQTVSSLLTNSREISQKYYPGIRNKISSELWSELQLSHNDLRSGGFYFKSLHYGPNSWGKGEYVFDDIQNSTALIVFKKLEDKYNALRAPIGPRLRELLVEGDDLIKILEGQEVNTQKYMEARLEKTYVFQRQQDIKKELNFYGGLVLKPIVAAESLPPTSTWPPGKYWKWKVVSVTQPDINDDSNPKKIYHGATVTWNSAGPFIFNKQVLEKSHHIFWVYAPSAKLQNKWDTHLPVSIYCNNHRQMDDTTFMCLGHTNAHDFQPAFAEWTENGWTKEWFGLDASIQESLDDDIDEIFVGKQSYTYK